MENAEKLAAYFPPPRESLLNAETLAAANPKLSEEQLQAVVVDGIQGAVTKPTHVNFAKLQDAVRAQLDALWTADADVEAVLADTAYSLDTSPTRVMELFVLTDDSRMYELRVDMPKGTAEEKQGTAVFKAARDRLRIDVP